MVLNLRLPCEAPEAGVLSFSYLKKKEKKKPNLKKKQQQTYKKNTYNPPAKH